MDEIKLSWERKDLLADLVIERYHDAASARNGNDVYGGKSVDQWFDEAIERFTKKFCTNKRFNLTRIKVGALHAKIKDMIINSVDAPFVIEATPIPQLSKEQSAKVIERLEESLGQKLMEVGLVVVDEEGNVWPDYDKVMVPDSYTLVPSVKEWLKAQAKEQRTVILNEASAIARDAIKHATTVILDQMYEGGWREAYLDCLFDLFLYGTGVLRIEQRRVQTLKWNGDNLVPSTDDIVTWRHVPIVNCYPSADSENAQEGTYFIERGAMRKQDLFAAAQIDWVNEDRVAEAYEAAMENYNWIENTDHESGERWADDSLIDVLIHEGTVRGDKLLDYFGDDDVQGIEESKFYDAEVWVVAGVCIGARLQEHPNGMRSYFSAQMQRVGRRFWGIGAAMTLSSIEDRLNQWLEDLDENLELSIAPPIFYNAAVFENPEDITLAKRAKVPFAAELGLNAGLPFHQVRIDSKSQELISLFNWAYRLADDESGIPGFLSGSAGHGGESTFRGMKMLAASSNMLIKDAFLNIDQTMIQPVMDYIWRWNMLHNDEAAIKADAKIIARGISGLLQREISDAERTDILPILMQLVQSAGLDEAQTTTIMQYLLSETMQQGGMPVEELLPNLKASAEISTTVQSLQPSTPLPTIGNDNNIGGLNVS